MTPTTPPAVNYVQSALSAGMSMATPRLLAGTDDHPDVVGVLVPPGSQFTPIDLEKYQERPRRKTGNVTLTTAQSFIDWVNRNKTPETVIYAKESDTSFKAIFNGHEAVNGPTQQAEGPRPGWGDFTALYQCPKSPEWVRWMKHSQHEADPKRGMGHSEFIEFIEENMLDITKPVSAQMLAAVRAFQATKVVGFKSAKRLDNGDVAFAYSEDTNEVVPEGQSKLALPSEFELTIPVFKSGAPYVIGANLRYRITSGGLVLFYELVRPHKSLEHAFAGVSEQIAKGTEVPMFST